MLPRRLVVSLIILGTLLTATAIDGPFTIDENNYLVTVLGLRQGRLSVPDTDGLPPSGELLYFDPSAIRREVKSTPVVSTAPPLYALFALAFSFLGWRGLIALNTIALLAAVAVAFVLARRFAQGPEAPWIAAFGVGAGAYLFEYGQAVWPHMLAVALVIASVWLASAALERDAPALEAAGAGLLAAAAAGVRYQNAFVLACIGLGLLLLARRRVQAAVAFAIGAALPLLASSFMNHARLGSWNPISKGPGYLPTPTKIGVGSSGFLTDALIMGWSRIVDYSKTPPLTGSIHESFQSPHPLSGAYVMVTAVKKAWLQSSPWIVVALVILAMAWVPGRLFTRILPGAPQRQLRLMSIVVIPTLAMFSASGVTRTDGLCFNQRYFCELVPLVAVAFAWGVEGVVRRRTAFLAGGLAGVTLAMAALAPHHLLTGRHYMVMYFPLALSVLLAGAWGVELAGRVGTNGAGGHGAFLALTVGASLAWATAIHLGDDVKADRILRLSRQDYLRQLRPFLEDHSAVFASGPIKDALGKIQMELDVVIADPAIDRAGTTKELVDTFLMQGRRVFFLPKVLPRDLLDSIFTGRRIRYLGSPTLLIEVGAIAP